ncbi:MAG: DUF1573 domain-containing protein [Bacteroidota bacterium]|nr:DUF1573 domain-containing protein [Bacteroidota bacterium]
MRKLSLILLIFISAIALKAQDKKKQVSSTAPDIKFDKMIHDYGTIRKNSDGSCEFTFKNVGKEPLVISNARASCGCTVPDWPKEPILPGKTGKIKVQYATSRVGPFNKSITITSNAKEETVVLNIKGTVEDIDETTPVKNISEGMPFAR